MTTDRPTLREVLDKLDNEIIDLIPTVDLWPIFHDLVALEKEMEEDTMNRHSAAYWSIKLFEILGTKEGSK